MTTYDIDHINIYYYELNTALFSDDTPTPRPLFTPSVLTTSESLALDPMPPQITLQSPQENLGTRLKPSSQYDARHLRCVGAMRHLTQCNAFLCVSLFTKFMRTHWYTCLFHVILFAMPTNYYGKWSVKKMTIEGFCYWLSYNIALFFSVP